MHQNEMLNIEATALCVKIGMSFVFQFVVVIIPAKHLSGTGMSELLSLVNTEQKKLVCRKKISNHCVEVGTV